MQTDTRIIRHQQHEYKYPHRQIVKYHYSNAQF